VSGNNENFWMLPPSPSSPPSVADLMRDILAVANRERAAALDEVARYAVRDGHGMVIHRRDGVIVDAFVARHVPAGKAYVVNVDLLPW
jgi:hypothetical protein